MFDPEEIRQARNHVGLALGRSVHVAFSVLPIRHGAPWLHGVVGRTRGDEGLVEHECRVREARFDITVRPLRQGLAHGHLALARGSEVLGGPLHLHDLTLPHDVPVGPGVRPTGTQALERIHAERKRLVVHIDRGDGVLRYGLVDRGHREDRRAHVKWLVREDRITRRRHFGKLVGRQNADHAVHVARLGQVDAPDACMRHGAGQQAAERHAVRTEILRIFRPPGHLGANIRWREVSANQVGHVTPPSLRA